MMSLYGNFRQKKFTDVWDNFDDFNEEFQETPFFVAATSSTPQKPITEDSLNILFYLLYGRYANSTIASSDLNQFKYKLFSIIFQFGPTWEKRLDIQDKLRGLTEDQIRVGSKQVNNHAYNPSTDPSTDAFDPLEYINEQKQNLFEKGILDGYVMLMSLLEKDVTEEFLDKFKKLFLVIVEPELPLWYVTDTVVDEEEDED